MKKITDNELSKLACEYGIELAALKAFMKVESRGSGFLPSGKVVILFERHIFYRESGGIPVSKTRPDLSSKLPGGYRGGEKEWERLRDAMTFHKIGALKSASWGLGQVMGFNHELAGYNTVQEMVEAFKESEYNQAKGMLEFIKNAGILPYIKAKDWAAVAKRYNGKNYAVNAYDTKLENAYNSFV